MANQPEQARIPSAAELKQLPRWARVAFAARCARRVQPLFSLAWKDAPGRDVQAVDGAISLAENAARNGMVVSKTSVASYHAAESAAHDALDANADSPLETCAYAAAKAAACAAYATAADAFDENAAEEAAEAYAAAANLDESEFDDESDFDNNNESDSYDETDADDDDVDEEDPRPNFYRNDDAAPDAVAASHAETAASNYDTAGYSATARVVTARVMLCDYKRLVALSKRRCWDDDSPVDSSLLGPIWPLCVESADDM